MTRTHSQHYGIQDEKLCAVAEEIHRGGANRDISEPAIADYILADWPEGQTHQDWLDNAAVEEIARWVTEGLVGQAAYIECASCAEGSAHGVPSVRHSTNPEWAGYWLCEECAAEYDSRPPINQACPA